MKYSMLFLTRLHVVNGESTKYFVSPRMLSSGWTICEGEVSITSPAFLKCSQLFSPVGNQLLPSWGLMIACGTLLLD